MLISILLQATCWQYQLSSQVKPDYLPLIFHIHIISLSMYGIILVLSLSLLKLFVRLRQVCNMTGKVDLKSNYILINVWSPHRWSESQSPPSPLRRTVNRTPARAEIRSQDWQSPTYHDTPNVSGSSYVSLLSQIFSFQFSIIQLLVKENSQYQENFLVLKKLPLKKEVSPWTEEL